MEHSFLDSWVDWGLKNKFWVFTIVLGFIGFAAYRVNDLTVDAVPDITNVQVMINTKTLGLDPEKVELTVTQPLEFEMMGLPDLIDMRSISKIGLSQITLIFKDGTDIYRARQQVSEKLQNVKGSIAEGLTPELAAISTGLGEVFMYSVSLKKGSEKKNLSEIDQLLYLREVNDYEIRPFLRKIKDVADVDVNGGHVKQLHININPEDLVRLGLTVDKVFSKLKGLGESFGGGYFELNQENYIIRASSQLATPEDFQNIPIAIKFDGKKIFLKDIASVSIDSAPRIGAATLEGQETVMGTILMKSGGNGRLVSTDVDQAIKALKIPDDVEIKTLYSRSYLVNATLHTVIKNLLEGAALVIVILMLILGHLRAALIVALVIPISMLWTTYGMQYFNISGNLMSLGAIDFGLVVDGAVVLVETLVASFATLTEIERRTLSKDQIVSSRAKVVIKPLVFGLVMIMLVYLPIILLEGTEGKMFRPMAFTVLMTLGFALILTIFFIPVMVSLFVKLPAPGEHHEDTWIFRHLKSRYQMVLNSMIDRPKILMIFAFLLASVSGVLFTRLGTDFIPQLDEGDLVLNIARVSKISLTESVAQQTKVDAVIKKHPEVELVFSRIGTTDSATDPMGVHLSDVFIILKKDRSTWSVTSKEELFHKIKREIEALGFEQEITATQPIEMRFNEMLEGSRADVSIKVLGPDLSYLVTLIDEFQVDVKDVKGLESAEMDALTALRKGKIIDIRPKFSELSKLGIGLDDFNQTIVTFLQGSQVGEWVQGVRKFPLIIHLAESHRESIESIRSLPVVLPDGGTVALERIADIEVIEKVTTIARNWGRRYAALSLNIGNRDTLSFVNDIRSIVNKRPVKEGHEVHLGGTFNNLEHAQKRLLIIIPLTLFLLIFILWRDLKSVKDTVMIFICVPFAAFGGVFALYFRDIHFSLSAAVGFIALIGVAHLNGIVLLTVFRQMIIEHPEKKLRDIVLEGTISRLRPVVMTALVASIGFIPMAVNTGLGSEVQRPLASVVIGGILFSTLLTLVILPAVYLYFTEKGRRNA